MELKLSDFDYELPAELIAQTPAKPRNHSRLLVYDRISRQIKDDFFYNLKKYLPANTTLVFNNSKVEKCRLVFGGVEIFVLDQIAPGTVKALVRPGRKFKVGGQLEIPLGREKLRIDTIAIGSDGVRTLQINLDLDDARLSKYRHTPFPPYIKASEKLSSQYQTVYASPLGSKASPTAGLHFTTGELKHLAKDHDIVYLTLHVGLGTFSPVKTDDLSRHIMHAERYFLTDAAAKKLNAAKHLTAVGTTTARTLESLGCPFRGSNGSTDIFIRPGYKYKNVDSLITNFHLPKSTLLMLVAAMVGVDELHRIYRHATSNKYRFYSFGDAMLIL